MPTEICSLPYLSPCPSQITSSDNPRNMAMNNYGYDIIANQMQNKATTSRQNKERSIKDADELYNLLPDQLQRAIDLAKEKSATWLTVRPLKDHGFSLHSSPFHDALALRHGWRPSKQPLKCECGNNFTVEHALSCARGGFPTIRHNKIRDLTAHLHTSTQGSVQ